MGARIEFLGWDGAALPRAAARLADAYAADGVLRMDAAIVALPGGRAGRRLKELLVAEAERRGARLVPPEVTTVGALPEQLYGADRPLADAVLRRRLLARLARTASTATLLPDPPAPDDMRGWAAFARVVERLHREACGAGLRFADIAKLRDATLLFDDSARWKELAALQDLYEAELARLGFADADLERLRVADTGGVVCDRELWLVGVAEMPVITRRLVEAAGARVLVHAPADMAHAFDAVGCVLPGYWATAEIAVADEDIDIVERPADQAAATLARIAALGGALAADEIVIGVPDDEVVSYLEQELAAEGVEVRYAAGQPIESTAPYRLLDAAADYIAEGSGDAFAALVRHPDAGRWIRLRAAALDDARAPALRREDGWIAPLDEYICEALPARVDRRLPHGGSGSGSAARRAHVDALRGLIHRELLAPLRAARSKTRTVADWMPAVMEVLAALYGHEDARPLRDDPRGRRLVGALRQLRDAAAALHRIPPGCDDACAAAAAVRTLLDEVAGGRVPPEPDHAAVELLGWLELHLDDAPAAIVTGANETVLPQAVNADAFLPNELRARLGMEDNARRHARDAYQLTAMMSSRELRVIAGRRNAAGDPLRPSRLLLAQRGPALAARVLRFLEETPRVETGRLEAGRRSAFRLPPEPVISAPAPLERLSVSDFAALLQNPYEFALKRILALEVVDTRARELDPLGFGSLAHDVLQRFGSSDAVNIADPDLVRHALDAALREETRRRFGAEPLPAVRIQVEQLRSRLDAFAEWHAGWIGEGWRVVATECGTEREGVPVKVGGESIRLTGRIDRVDYHAADDRYVVFDYKTGERGDKPDAVHRKGRTREWVDLQLPLYRHLAPHIANADGTPVIPGVAAVFDLGYILLCRDREQIGGQLAEWGANELAEADACAARMIRLVRANAFAYEPGRRLRDDGFVALLGLQLLAESEEDEGGDVAMAAAEAE